MKFKEKTVQKILDVLGAETYKVRLVHTDNLKSMVNMNFPNKLCIYTADSFLRSIDYLSMENKKGYNIYFRPQGYEYVLLDDLKKEVLTSLAELKPCLLIETSYQNYQAWLKLRTKPKNKEEATEICRLLTEQFQADEGSADPEHVGRLPTYTNRKPQYYNPITKQYPFVILHKAESRYSTFLFSPSGGVCLKECSKENQTQNPQMLKKIEEKGNYTDHDRSRYDFNNVCMWLRQNKTYNQIYDLLESTSEKAKSRVGYSREKYLTTTISNAIRTTKIQPKQ